MNASLDIINHLIGINCFNGINYLIVIKCLNDNNFHKDYKHI